MSPIDDELRAALHGRAQVLTPSPDPLAGIERRAKRIQRNRVGAAVAGSALAVAMVAVAVPAVQGATSTNRPDTPIVAQSQAPDTSAYELDPQNPWTFRGIPVSDEDRAMIEREYATRTGGTQVSVTPLYAGRFEGSDTTDAVFVAQVDGEQRWGVASYPTHAGLEIVWDEALPQPALALAAALPGDEVPRLLVVASPDAGPIHYGTQGSDEATIGSAEQGVGVTAIERDTGSDFYRVLAEGQTLVEAPAPDPVDLTQEQPTEPRTGAALDPEAPWELRGDRSLVTDAQLDALAQDWAERHGEPAGDVTLTPLYVAADEPSATVEVFYVVRSGDGPWSWGVSALGDGRWSWYVDRPLEEATEALPAALPGDEGVERLVIVAAPFVGGAVYAADGSDFQPMTDREMGVFITPITPGDADDRFKVLDGSGDLDNPIVEGEAPDYQNAG